MVRHQPNRASGGRSSIVEVSEFLSEGHGPQHEALLRLSPRRVGVMAKGRITARTPQALVGQSAAMIAPRSSILRRFVPAAPTNGLSVIGDEIDLLVAKRAVLVTV
jgi:hypothetical protein